MLLFYVNNLEKKTVSFLSPGRVTINGTVAQFSCSASLGNCAGCERQQGERREQRAIATNLLDNIKSANHQALQGFPNREAFITAEMVRNAYQGLGGGYDALLKSFDRDL